VPFAASQLTRDRGSGDSRSVIPGFDLPSKRNRISSVRTDPLRDGCRGSSPQDCHPPCQPVGAHEQFYVVATHRKSTSRAIPRPSRWIWHELRLRIGSILADDRENFFSELVGPSLEIDNAFHPAMVVALCYNGKHQCRWGPLVPSLSRSGSESIPTRSMRCPWKSADHQQILR
jgi:hypothetical protein